MTWLIRFLSTARQLIGNRNTDFMLKKGGFHTALTIPKGTL